MIPLEEYDIQLAKAIRKSGQEKVVQYAVDLLGMCLLSPSPITFMEDHALTLAALHEIQDPPSRYMHDSSTFTRILISNV